MILGAGSIGGSVAEHLAQENEVTLIDRNAEVITNMRSRFDARFIIGSIESPQVLEKAGCEEADVVLAVTEHDVTNLAACFICKTLFDPGDACARIARIRNRGLAEHKELLQAFGVTVSYDPEDSIAEAIASAVGMPGVSRLVHYASRQLAIAEVRIREQDISSQNKLSDFISHSRELGYYLVAIRRGDLTLPATESLHLQVDDSVILAAKAKNMAKTIMLLRNEQQLSTKVFIAGGGQIGRALAAKLEDDYAVTLLEPDAERCKILAHELGTTLVTAADPTVEEVLRSEDVENGHFFCAVSEKDEVNIMSALIAKKLNCKHAAVLINRHAYQAVLSGIKMDMVVSPSEVTISILLQRLSSRSYFDPIVIDEQVTNLTMFPVQRSSKIQGQTMAQVNWPDNTLPCALLRDVPEDKPSLVSEALPAVQIYFPDSEVSIEPGDRCIVYVKDANIDTLTELADLPYFT